MANKKGPTRLSEVEVDWLSLVNKGANKKPRWFRILKTGDAPEGEMEELQFAEILKADLGTEEQIRETLGKTAPELSTDATDAMVGIVKLAQSYSEELPSDIFETLAEVSGFEKAATKKAFPPVNPEETPEEKIKRLEEEAASQKKSKGTKKMEKSDESDPIKVALDKIEKEADIDTLPEDIQKAVRPLWKAYVESQEEAKKSQEEIRKMQDDALTKEFIVKAAEYQHIPKTESFATLLKSMSQKLTPEEFTAVEGIFKATEEGFKESNLYKEVGSEAAISGTPEGQLSALAKERVTKSEGSITFAQAMSDVTMEHPEIYDDMLKNRGTR